MKISTTNLKSFLVASVCMMTAGAASAVTPWECVLPLRAADAVYVTSKGTVLAADNEYWFPATSGIYYSDDEGENWTQASVGQYLYNYFFEAGDYVFALGESSRIARSADDGHTWIVLNYERYIEDLVPASDLDYVTAYTASYDPEKQRIYVPVYSSTVGVIYTDDFGETWHYTDRESMTLHFEDGTSALDTFYGSTFFNGELQVYGIYRIFVYDDENDRWTCTLTPEGYPYSSNFLGVTAEHDGVLYAARAMEDEDPEKPFVQYTTDLVHWDFLGHPSNIVTNYVRALAIDSKGEYLYAATINQGIYRTKDKGENWEIIGEGLPMHPEYSCYADRAVAMTLTDNYLFVAQHDFNNPTSGIYRIAISDEMGQDVSIEEVLGDAGVEVEISADGISAPGAASIAVFSTTGVQVLAAAGESLSTSSLAAAPYVYVVKASNGAEITGKFIKR